MMTELEQIGTASDMLGSNIVDALLISGLISLAVWLIVAFLAFRIFSMPIYHPFSLYLIYHFLGFIARPLTVYRTGYSHIWDRIGFTPSLGEVAQITYITNLSLVCCAVGLFVVAGRRKQIRRIPPTKFSSRRPFGLAAASIIIIVLGGYANYRSYGSLGLDEVQAFQTNFDDAGGQQLVGVSGYVTALAEFLPILCVILLLSDAPKIFSYSVTAGFVGLRLLVGAQRLSFVVVIAAAFFNQLIQSGRRAPRAGLLIMLVLGFFLFDMLGSDRLAFRRLVQGDATVGQVWNSYADDRLGGPAQAADVLEYEVATAAISIVDNYSGYSFGSQYLRILIWPIPRQIWPNKPVYTSTVNLNAYEYNFVGLTYSLYADLYMAFGIPAIVIGMLLLGWGMGKIYKVAVETSSAVAYTFFWVFLLYLKTILRDGGVTFVYFWIFSMIAAAIVIYMGRLELVRVLPRSAIRVGTLGKRSASTEVGAR